MLIEDIYRWIVNKGILSRVKRPVVPIGSLESTVRFPCVCCRLETWIECLQGVEKGQSHQSKDFNGNSVGFSNRISGRLWMVKYRLSTGIDGWSRDDGICIKLIYRKIFKYAHLQKMIACGLWPHSLVLP